MSRRALAGALALLGALVAAGCGLGPGEPTDGGVRLTVTRDFGAQRLGAVDRASVPGGTTVMRLLQREFDVETRYGGGFVQSIDGLAGGREDGRAVDWFFFVNGIESDEGAASVDVERGDRVWWDRRDWGAAMSVPAVVGSFPEPFRSGVGGKRLPVRLECAEATEAACDAVAEALGRAGAPAARSRIATEGGPELLRVVVGPLSEVLAVPAVRQLERGPGASGVYARAVARGRGLEVLDARGRVTRRLGPGAGIVAATRYLEEGPTWIVAGTDAAGTDAAARLLTESALRDRFAVATTGEEALRLPDAPAGP